jgi:predicted MFS family arabinose efflux permease
MGAAFFAVLDTRMGAAPWLLAIVTAAPYVANLFAPAWVAQSQHWGIRLLVVASLVASAGVLLLLSLAPTPVVFALLVVLYYLFYGVSDPLYVALAELVYPERTGTKLGRAQALFNAAHIGAALLAGWLLDQWGELVPLALAAASTLIAAFVYLPLPAQMGVSKDETASPWRIVREDRMIRRILLFFMVSGTGMVMMLPILPLIEVRLVGLSNSEIGMLLAANSAALIVASWGWGALAEQLKRLLPLFYLALVAMLGMALLYAFGRSFGLLLIANILCGIGGGALAIAWRLFAMQIEAYRTDDLAGLHLLTCGLRGLYAPALGVLMVSFWNPMGTMLVAAGMIALGGLVLLPLKEADRTSPSNVVLQASPEREHEPL